MSETSHGHKANNEPIFNFTSVGLILFILSYNICFYIGCELETRGNIIRDLKSKTMMKIADEDENNKEKKIEPRYTVSISSAFLLIEIYIFKC